MATRSGIHGLFALKRPPEVCVGWVIGGYKAPELRFFTAFLNFAHTEYPVFTRHKGVTVANHRFEPWGEVFERPHHALAWLMEKKAEMLAEGWTEVSLDLLDDPE
jgi:hypothetical protein